MAQKEKNAELARKILSNAFWKSEFFPKYFSDDFTMEIPSAPPGMPNYFCTWEAERCFEWLNRTVMSWTMDLEEFYTTPDPDQFWAIGSAYGDVFWGKDPGEFKSKYFARLEMKDGKVHFLKVWVDAISFLQAANLDYTRIIKDTDDPRIDSWLTDTPKRFTIHQDQTEEKQEDEYAGVDMSEEAIEKRLKANLGQNVCGVEREKYREEETFNPNYKRGAWFIPDYLPWSDLPEDEYSLVNNDDPIKQAPPELSRRQHAWVKASSPWMYRDTRGKNYPTDDKYVWFSEMYSNGPAVWIGNGCEEGHYHEQFLMVQKFDKAGRELIRDEVICPPYKYASAKVALPSFPYYA